MAELADAADSKSAEVKSRVGSSPTFGTINVYRLRRLSARVGTFERFALKRSTGCWIN